MSNSNRTTEELSPAPEAEEIQEALPGDSEARDAREELDYEENAQDPAAEEAAIEKPRDPNRLWYVIHTYSGYEKKVKDNLERRIETMGMREKIFRVLVPTEEEIEFRDGKKKTVEKKIYPGYVLIEMIMAEDSWYVVRNTTGVTGFVSPGSKPVPLPQDEIDKILRMMGELETPKVKIDLSTGQSVRVIHGPFQDFHGVVEEVNPNSEKVKVLITIFGRETPVELEFGHVEKLV